MKIVAREHTHRPTDRCPLCHLALDSTAVASNGQLTRCGACNTLAHSGCVRDLSGGRCPIAGCQGGVADEPLATSSTCPWCAERAPPDATRCPSCAEPLEQGPILRWVGDAAEVRIGVSLPASACWFCARRVETRPRPVTLKGPRPDGSSGLAELTLPACTSCTFWRLVPIAGGVAAGVLGVPILSVLHGGVGVVVGVCLGLVALVLGVLLYERYPRVRCVSIDGLRVRLIVPRPSALRGALGRGSP